MTAAAELSRVHVSYSRSECEVIRSMLSAYGIPAYIRGRHFADVQPHLLVAMDGLRLEVPRAAHMEAAKLIRDVRGAATLPESVTFRRHWLVSVIFCSALFFFLPYCPVWLRWRIDVSEEIEGPAH